MSPEIRKQTEAEIILNKIDLDGFETAISDYSDGLALLDINFEEKRNAYFEAKHELETYLSDTYIPFN